MHTMFKIMLIVASAWHCCWSMARPAVQVKKFLPHAMTGTPEARTFLMQLQRAGHVLHDTDVTVFDDGYPLDKSGQLHPQAADFLRLKDGYEFFKGEAPAGSGKHGMKVASLIAGQAPIGVGSRARIAQLISADELMNFNVPPQLSGVVNICGVMVIFHYELLNGVAHNRHSYLFQPLSDNTVTVQAAWNSFDLERSIESEHHDFDFLGKHVIRVGAVDHTGVVLDYSQGGERVAILAPTDVVSFDGNEERMFGGTSAAAPFVSAALADTAAFLPALSKEEAEYLLRKTAIRTSTQLVSNFNGAGVLNHYKLLRVAHKLAEQGYTGGELYSDHIYNFSEEVETLLAEAKMLASTSENYLHNLRIAFFLQPEDNRVRTLLADVYRSQGHVEHALYYDVPARSLERKEVLGRFAQRVRTVLDVLDRTPLQEEMNAEVLADIDKWLAEMAAPRATVTDLNTLGRKLSIDVWDVFEHESSSLIHWLPAIENNDNYKVYEIIVLLHLTRLADRQGNLNLLIALQAYASAKYPNFQFMKDIRLFRQTKQ